MAAKPYSFNTDSHYDVKERGVIGSAPGAGAPVIKLKIGASLFRLLHQYGSTGLVLAQLSALPVRPTQILNPMSAGSRLTLIPAISRTELYADPDGTVDYRYLQADYDGQEFEVGYIDATFTSGDIACPELKTWCEAFGGTYTKAT